MKPDTQKQQEKSFNFGKIYLAGPFFNEIQKSWATHLAKELRERGYKIFAPVDEIYNQEMQKSARHIFNRNLLWMSESGLVLAQLDYPLDGKEKLAVVNEVNDSEFNSIAYNYKPVSMPDCGTVWEMGWAYQRGIPIIGYTSKPVVEINLMLAECLYGYIDNPLDVFTEGGILHNLIKKWEGKKL
jgi:nucleoside 2-deoxyribosyltransferase